MYIRAALITHELEWLEHKGRRAELELKSSTREIVYIRNTNVTQTIKHILSYYWLSLSCFVYNSHCIQAVLSVILTFVPLYRKQDVNKDMYSSMQAHFKMK